MGDLLRGVDGLQSTESATEGSGGEVPGDFFLQYVVWYANQFISTSLTGLNPITLPPQLLNVLPDGGPAEAELPADFLP
jgi:hypothetical protein